MITPLVIWNFLLWFSAIGAESRLGFGDAMGYVDDSRFPWIHSSAHGWLLVAESDEVDGRWVFDPQLQDWWFSAPEMYPWLYRATGHWREASRLYKEVTSPNIVFFFIDDFGYGDLSIYGNEVAHTPNFDRLATEGGRFLQAYVSSSVCSPSRVGVTTGQYPHRWRINSFLGNPAGNRDRGMPVDWLDPSAPSLARILADNGYATAHSGKWHMGGQRAVANAPWIHEFGFDESFTNSEGMGDRVLNVFDEHEGGVRPLGIDRTNSGTGRGSLYWTPRANATQAYVDRGIDFIRHNHASGKPFYLNVWPMDTHLPYEPPLERRGDRSAMTLLTGVIEEMDEQFGRLFDFIRKDPYLRDNTLIIVSSDNGPAINGPGNKGGLRGGKATVYEGGHRVPLIVWGPGLIPKEKTGFVDQSTVFSLMDLPPSLLRLLDLQDANDVVFDGLDMSEALLGKPVERTTPLFWTHPANNSPQAAMRQDQWKLTADWDGSRLELYDLDQDPAESVNLAGEFPDRVAEMMDALLAWKAEMDAAAVPLPLQSERPARIPELQASSDMLFGDSFTRADSLLVDSTNEGIIGSVGMQMSASEAYFPGFRAFGTGTSRIENQSLVLALAGSMSELAIRHNFIDDAIVQAGGFSVEMEVFSMSAVAEALDQRYAGFGVGLTESQASTGGPIHDPNSYRGDVGNPGVADCFVELDMNRQVKVWLNGELAAEFPLRRSYGHLRADFFLKDGFDVGGRVVVEIYFEGHRLESEPLAFTWSADASNYIGISAHAGENLDTPGEIGDQVIVDNFAVRWLNPPAD